MITRIEIDGFKSFKDFVMEFTPFTVIAGVNGSGKSNLFDALQLLSRLAEADLKTAFGGLRGEGYELFMKYDDETSANEMSFAVEMLVDGTVRDNWGEEATLHYTRLRYELRIAMRINEKGLEDIFVTHESLAPLKHKEDRWIKIINPSVLGTWRPKLDSGRHVPYIETTNNGLSFVVRQDGTGGRKRDFSAKEARQSVLSGITTVAFPHILAAREEMRAWKFLQFNPEDLREPTRQGPNTSDVISHSGKNLAAALFRIKLDDDHNMVAISRKINQFLPEFTSIEVTDDRANKQFIIKLKSADGKEYTSRVLSEGTLRLLALCVLLYDDRHKGLLCFEEPENGIHPSRIKPMIRLLKELSADFSPESPDTRQVIINTHSPRLLGECLKLDDACLSIWFTEMTTKFGSFEGRRYSVKASKVVPGSKDKQMTIGRSLSEQDIKIGLYEMTKYLSEPEL